MKIIVTYALLPLFNLIRHYPNIHMNKRNVLFGILSIIAGLVFVVMGVKERSSLARTKASGITAIVQPPVKYETRTRRGSTTYSAEFTFRTNDGGVVTRKRSFPEELLSDFRSGKPVKVFYDPKNPREFAFEKEEQSWLSILMGLGFLGVSAYLLLPRTSRKR